MKTTKLMVSMGDIWITSNLVDMCIEDENLYRVRDNFDVVNGINKLREAIKNGTLFELRNIDRLKDLAWVENIEFETVAGPEVGFWILTEREDGFCTGYECADEEEYRFALVNLLREFGNV